jgi:plastocyanin
MRVLVAAGVFAAGGLASTALVGATGHEINVTGDAAKCDKTWGPPCFTPANGTITPVAIGDTVTWHVLDGTHTVTPADPAAFAGSGDLTGPDGNFNVTFDRGGVFSFYCKHHGSMDKDGKTFHGMWGRIDVRGGDTTTSSAPPPAAEPPGGSNPPKPDPGPPPSPGPANPPPASPSGPPPSGSPPSSGSNGSTGSNSNGSNGSNGSPNGQTASGSGRPYVGPPPTAPPPSSSSSSPPPRSAAGNASGPSSTPSSSKARDAGAESASPAGTSVPPEDAVLPPSPPFSPATTAPVAEAPGEVPQGDTVAVLKAEPGGHRRRLILVGMMFGVGVFVVSVGGWKFVHRASKYWPA